MAKMSAEPGGPQYFFRFSASGKTISLPPPEGDSVNVVALPSGYTTPPPLNGIANHSAFEITGVPLGRESMYRKVRSTGFEPPPAQTPGHQTVLLIAAYACSRKETTGIVAVLANGAKTTGLRFQALSR